MVIHFLDYGAGFKLGEFNSPKGKRRNKKLEDIIDEEFPESKILINSNDEVEYLDKYFVGDNPVGGIKWMQEFLEDLPIKGTYTVPELNLKDATFKEVLESVRNYYIQKLSTYKKRTAKV